MCFLNIKHLYQSVCFVYGISYVITKFFVYLLVVHKEGHFSWMNVLQCQRKAQRQPNRQTKKKDRLRLDSNGKKRTNLRML